MLCLNIFTATMVQIRAARLDDGFLWSVCSTIILICFWASCPQTNPQAQKPEFVSKTDKSRSLCLRSKHIIFVVLWLLIWLRNDWGFLYVYGCINAVVVNLPIWSYCIHKTINAQNCHLFLIFILSLIFCTCFSWIENSLNKGVNCL